MSNCITELSNLPHTDVGGGNLMSIFALFHHISASIQSSMTSLIGSEEHPESADGRLVQQSI